MYKHKNGITLKKIESQDLHILKVLKDESWFGTHNISIVNSDDQLKWFNSLSNDKQLIMMAIDESGSNSFLSNCGVGIYKISNIDWINRKYDSAHDVFAHARGKGYSHKVLEAGVDFGFEVLNMHRLDTEVLENNLASMKSALKVGFIEEGRKRKCIHKCNEYLDSVFLGILHDEWKELDRVKAYGGICNTSYTPKNGK